MARLDGQRKAANVATGIARGNSYRGMRRVVCAFDPETFETIRNRAVKQNTSFAEQVRLLCEWGLEADA